MITAIIVKVLSRFSPYIFQDLSKIDPEKEGLIDFCPICQEQLPDKKILTFKTHEKEKHSVPEKQMIKEYVSRNMWLPVLIFFVVGVPILLVFVGEPISQYLDPLEYDLQEKCKMEVRLWKIGVYDNGGVIASDITLMNHFIEDCDFFGTHNKWFNDIPYLEDEDYHIKSIERYNKEVESEPLSGLELLPVPEPEN